jgi:hypothetical protein
VCLEHGKILKPSTGRCNDCKNIEDEEDLSAKEQLVKWSNAFYLPTANKTLKQLCRQLIAYIAHHGGEISDLLMDVGYKFPAGVSVVKQKAKQIAKEIQVAERIQVVEKLVPQIVERQLSDVEILELAQNIKVEDPELQEEYAKALKLVSDIKLQPSQKKTMVMTQERQQHQQQQPLKYPPAQTITSKKDPNFRIQLDGYGRVRVMLGDQIIKEASDIIGVDTLAHGGMIYVDGKRNYTVFAKVFNLEKQEFESKIYEFSLDQDEWIMTFHDDNTARTNLNNVIMFEYAAMMSSGDYAHLQSLNKNPVEKAQLIKEYGVQL